MPIMISSSVANCGKQSLHKFLYKTKIETVILSYDTNAKKAKNLYTNAQRCVLPVFFGEFITAIAVNPPERKVAKRTSVR